MLGASRPSRFEVRRHVSFQMLTEEGGATRMGGIGIPSFSPCSIFHCDSDAQDTAPPSNPLLPLSFIF